MRNLGDACEGLDRAGVRRCASAGRLGGVARAANGTYKQMLCADPATGLGVAANGVLPPGLSVTAAEQRGLRRRQRIDDMRPGAGQEHGRHPARLGAPRGTHEIPVETASARSTYRPHRGHEPRARSRSGMAVYARAPRVPRDGHRPRRRPERHLGGPWVPGMRMGPRKLRRVRHDRSPVRSTEHDYWDAAPPDGFAITMAAPPGHGLAVLREGPVLRSSTGPGHAPRPGQPGRVPADRRVLTDDPVKGTEDLTVNGTDAARGCTGDDADRRAGRPAPSCRHQRRPVRRRRPIERRSYEFASTRPCKLVRRRRRFTVDTHAVADGQAQLQGPTRRCGSGNATTVVDRTVKVHNNADLGDEQSVPPRARRRTRPRCLRRRLSAHPPAEPGAPQINGDQRRGDGAAVDHARPGHASAPRTVGDPSRPADHADR